MSNGVYVLLTCLVAILLVFPLTAAFNLKDRLSGKDISSHRSAVAATKSINIIVLIALLLPIGGRSWSTICVPEFLYAALVINAAAFIIWVLFAMTDTSMHIHTLTELYRASGISKAELFARYRKDTIVDARVGRLLTLGQLQLQDGKLRVAGRTVLLGAEMCKVFRRLLGIPVRPPID
jgi:hypothetical protein